MVEKVIFTNMCMICNGNKLVVMKSNKKDYEGIIFPGGHVENGESFTEAVIREVKEETNLNIEHPKLCGIKNWMNDKNERYVVFLYKANVDETKLLSSNEGEVFWEEISNLDNLDLASDMKEMVKVFNNENLSEFFYFKEKGDWKFELK